MLNAFRHQRFDTCKGRSFNKRCVVCSTPFGIRDSTHSLANVKRLYSTVLNAFRHQRFDTGKYSTLFARGWCAQRLSASEIRHARTTTTSSRALRSAQRLSASEIRHINATRHNTEAIQGAQRLSASEIRHKV